MMVTHGRFVQPTGNRNSTPTISTSSRRSSFSAWGIHPFAPLRRSTHKTSTNESWPCFVTSRTRLNAEQRGQKQQPGKTQESCFRPLIFSMAIWLDDQQATFTAPACMLFCIRENTNCCPCTEMPLSIARKVKAWCQEARQDEVIVQVDLRIAFNSGSQRALA